MKAGLVLALWEVTTHVSLGGCLFILAGPTSGKHMESESRAEFKPGKKILFFYQMRMLIATCKEF